MRRPRRIFKLGLADNLVYYYVIITIHRTNASRLGTKKGHVVRSPCQG
jgi:hypothetical protein